MSYNIPYSFIPGTKARAQEVNANFKYVTDTLDEINTDKLNTSFSNITQEAIDIIKNNTSIRNIGEIIPSAIPLNDFGLHLLDGTILRYGSYKDFIDYIAGLYDDDPTANYFTTEANWQTSVSTYGACGKFVYDSVNNTVRLPKLTGIVEGTADLTALGNLIEAGLPDHIHYVSRSGDISNEYVTSEGSTGSDTVVNYNGNMIRNTSNASVANSNSLYGKSNTVQPQTIKILYYIVVATTAKTEIQVDIDEIATDLNGKMDTDFSNMSASQSVKNTIISWTMPDYSAGVTISSGWTATYDCIGYCTSKQTDNKNYSIKVNGVEVAAWSGGGYPKTSGAQWLVPKGSTVTYTGEFGTSPRVYPLKGEN